MKLRSALLFAIAGLLAQAAFAQVTFDRILAAGKEPRNWLTYSGSTYSQRYSTLDQITPANVKNLELQWIFQARSLEKFEATPLAVDGVLYTVEAPNNVVALDALTGRVLWEYGYTPSRDARPCCGRVNRGLAILGDTVYMGTIDAHLLALDAKTGTLLWNVKVADAAAGYAITHAPLIIKNKVIVGTAGGEYGIRGFIAAYDTKTGKEDWRFYTVPGKGEPGNETSAGDSWKTGGGSVWMRGFDEKGRPMRVPGKVPTPRGTVIKPGNQGGTNWYSPSFSPRTGLFYISAWTGYSSVYVKQPVEYTAGRLFAGAMPQSPVPMVRSGPINLRTDAEGTGAVRAIDPATGDMKWEFKMSDVIDSGILTTASNLLFVGGREGYFFALDAGSGAMLWKASVGGQVSAGPMTYSLGGRQYVAISAGNALYTFALRQP